MYPPLEFCRNMDIEAISDKLSFKKVLKDLDGREERALLFLTYDKDMLNQEYKGEFSDMNRWLIKNRDKMYQIMFGPEAGYVEGSKADHDAAADCILPYLMARVWSRNKQVYTFDAELEKML